MPVASRHLRGGVEAGITCQAAIWPLDQRVIGEEEASLVVDFGRARMQHHRLPAVSEGNAEVEHGVVTANRPSCYRRLGTLGGLHLPKFVSVGQFAEQILRFLYAKNPRLPAADGRPSQGGYAQQESEEP